jgi:hypothetical protein
MGHSWAIQIGSGVTVPFEGASFQRRGAGVHKGPATPAVGPAQGFTSARRLGLVRGRDYSCERVVVAEAETCRANGLP